MTRPECDEGGDTLIELLVTITVVGLTIVSLLGAYLNVIGSSARHRAYATIDTVLKNFAETATYQIQLSSSPSPLFTPCATMSGTATSSSHISYAGTQISYQPPSGYTIQMSSAAQYLYNNSNFQTTGCDLRQNWPQLFTLTATGPKGSTTTLSFVVADPANETYQQPTTTTSTTTTTTTPTTTSSTTTTVHEHGH